MNAIERDWVELAVLLVILVGAVVWRRAFAHVPLRRVADDDSHPDQEAD